MVQRNELPAMRVHDQLRFNRIELLEWALTHFVELNGEILESSETGDFMPTLTESLREGGIHFYLPGVDRTEALRAAVGKLPLPEAIDRELLLRVLLARENLSSTGFGDGVAIPHVRNPLVLRVPRPLVTLNFLARPVDFQAVDGLPVFALFLLVSPSVRLHLRLLSRLAYALRKPELKERLRSRAAAADILEVLQAIEAEMNGKPAVSADRP